MLISLANKTISKIKGQSYTIDPKVSVSYLLNLLFTRLWMLVRGKVKFMNNKGPVFIGRGVTIKARHLISFGKGVTIDDNCYVDALSHSGIKLGNNVSFGKNTVVECSGSLKFLGKGLIVGNNVGLGRDCFYGCAGGIEIGDDTIVGNFVSLHAENHITSEIETPIRLQGVTHKGIKIGKNCWIGAKATILDGAIVNDGCIIAAGAVVSSGIYEANGIYGGIPARLIKSRVPEVKVLS